MGGEGDEGIGGISGHACVLASCSAMMMVVFGWGASAAAGRLFCGVDALSSIVACLSCAYLKEVCGVVAA